MHFKCTPIHNRQEVCCLGVYYNYTRLSLVIRLILQDCKSLFWKTKSSWKLMYGLSRYNTLVTNTYNIHDNKCN